MWTKFPKQTAKVLEKAKSVIKNTMCEYESEEKILEKRDRQVKTKSCKTERIRKERKLHSGQMMPYNKPFIHLAYLVFTEKY